MSYAAKCGRGRKTLLQMKEKEIFMERKVGMREGNRLEKEKQ